MTGTLIWTPSLHQTSNKQENYPSVKLKKPYSYLPESVLDEEQLKDERSGFFGTHYFSMLKTPVTEKTMILEWVDTFPQTSF